MRNVFANLSLKVADELQAKSGLVFRISQEIQKKNLTQKHSAAILGIDQPKISSLLRGRLDSFSAERPFRSLNALGQDVEITIRPKRRSREVADTRASAA